MTRIQVRQARPEDGKFIEALIRTFSGDNPSPSKGGPTLANIEATLVGLDRERAIVAVAEADKAVCGVIAYFLLPSVTHAGRTFVFIDLLVVLPHNRRHGIGTALVRHALAFARRAGSYKVALVTRNENHVAHAFYRTLRFQVNSVALAFYPEAP